MARVRRRHDWLEALNLLLGLLLLAGAWYASLARHEGGAGTRPSRAFSLAAAGLDARLHELRRLERTMLRAAADPLRAHAEQSWLRQRHEADALALQAAGLATNVEERARLRQLASSVLHADARHSRIRALTGRAPVDWVAAAGE